MASSLSIEDPLDSMQYQDGDVVVRLSSGPAGMLLLHSDVLSESSAYFKAIVSKDKSWVKPRSVVYGEKKLEVYELNMIFDRELRVARLTGEASSIGASKGAENIMPAHLVDKSRYAGGAKPLETFAHDHIQPEFCEVQHQDCGNGEISWEPTYMVFRDCYQTILPARKAPDVEPPDGLEASSHSYMVSYYSRLHISLFACAYGMDITLSKGMDLDDTVVFCANLLRLADDYIMTDVVSHGIEKCLTALTGIWKAIARDPVFFLMLGYHLKSSVIFLDAMKHVIARDILFDSAAGVREPHEDLLPRDVIEFAIEAHKSLSQAFSDLVKRLMRLGIPGLQESWAQSDICGASFNTEFQVDYRGGKRFSEEVAVLADLLGTRLLHQYVTLTGPGDLPKPAHVLLIRKLLTCGRWRDKSDMTYISADFDRVVEVFGVKSKEGFYYELQAALTEIVKRIVKVFNDHHFFWRISGIRAQYEPDEYFTYLQFDCWNIGEHHCLNREVPTDGQKSCQCRGLMDNWTNKVQSGKTFEMRTKPADPKLVNTICAALEARAKHA